MKFKINDYIIDYEIVRKDNKNLYFRFDENSKLIITTPRFISDSEVQDLITKNSKAILKMYEGVAGTLLKVIKGTLKSSVPGMIGGALIKKPLKTALKDFDASRYGGAPLLGLKGLVVKAHGSSKAVEIKNAVAQCALFYKEDVNGKIRILMEEQAEKQRLAKKAAKEAETSKEQS